MPDFVSNFDPGPGKPLPEYGDMSPDSTVFPGLATLTSDGAEVRQLSTLVLPDFVSAFDPGPGTPSPESGDRLGRTDFTNILELPDFAGDFDKDSDIDRSDVIRTVDPGGDDVSSQYVRPVLRNRFTIMIISVILL